MACKVVSDHHPSGVTIWAGFWKHSIHKSKQYSKYSKLVVECPPVCRGREYGDKSMRLSGQYHGHLKDQQQLAVCQWYVAQTYDTNTTTSGLGRNEWAGNSSKGYGCNRAGSIKSSRSAGQKEEGTVANSRLEMIVPQLVRRDDEGDCGARTRTCTLPVPVVSVSVIVHVSDSATSCCFFQPA